MYGRSKYFDYYILNVCINSIFLDEVEALVVHLGHNTIRAAFAGEDGPKVHISAKADVCLEKNSREKMYCNPLELWTISIISCETKLQSVFASGDGPTVHIPVKADVWIEEITDERCIATRWNFGQSALHVVKPNK